MLIATLAWLLLSDPAPRVQPLTLYIGAVVRTSPEGFTDPIPRELADSVKDLQKHLRHAHEVTLVDTPAEADLILRVLGREVSSTPDGGLLATRTYGGGIYVGPTSDTWCWLHTELQAGTYRRPFDAVRGPVAPWSDNAQFIARALVAWVKTNAAVVHQQRRAQ